MLKFVAAAFEMLFSKFAVTLHQNQAAGVFFTPLNKQLSVANKKN
jgi:hypothetical protein